MTQHIKIISAGAGSGKTFSITNKLQELLRSNQIRPSGVIATTFTKLAAGELQERVRQKLIEEGLPDIANAMGESLIGTVNGVCYDLLRRFAFEAGVSPEQKVLEESQAEKLFAEALEETLIKKGGISVIRRMNTLSRKLGFEDKLKRGPQQKSLPLWQKEVMNIVASARANNMTSQEVNAFAQSSITSFSQYLPKQTERDLNSELTNAIQSAVNNVDFDLDATQGTKKYFDALEGLLRTMEHSAISWSDWIGLTQKAPGKTSLALAEPIQTIASDFAKHPDFQEDIKTFIKEVFAISAASLENFQLLKRKMGLIDFVDQEQALLDILDHPFVKETLADELDLLMVDEFQDTSPIQLAVFIKLADLAKQVIWVGDVKQSIYSFRGADPELMSAVIKYLESQGNTTEILDQSWRSRPPLVHYVNNIFSHAFSDSLAKDQVVLKPARFENAERAADAAVEHWFVNGSNKAKRALAIGAQVRKLIASGQQVFDKKTQQYRSAQYGDLAVLCRTNNNLAEIAEGFNSLGIPCEYKRSGLLATPEGCFALACLRRLVDESDTLASAEIITLSDCKSPEDWLNDRLTWLDNNHLSKDWAEADHSILKALKQQRKRLSILSPVEVMTMALDVSNARKHVIAWCDTDYEAQQRLGNIDLFIRYAQDYQQQCESNNRAATASGLILYLAELQENEEDLQALPGSNAVQLVTHHRSKGLEWPIVIAMDIESDIQSRLWGLNVIEKQDGFNWQTPLEGRSLQYWPPFFGLKSKNIELKEKIEAGENGQKLHHKAVEETKRLLYVSLTRARDLLILPRHQKKGGGEWLKSLDSDWMLAEGDHLTLPDGQSIAYRFQEVPECSTAESPVTRETIYWLDKVPRFKVEKHHRKLSPSRAKRIEAATIGQVVELGERIPFSGAPDMAMFGSCLHAIIATEIIHRDLSKTRAKRILVDFGMADFIQLDDALATASRFIEHVTATFSPTNWHVEYPIQYVNEQAQECNGYIDLAIETEQGWVIIDHKSSPRKRSEWEDISLSYSGQLALYKEALKASGKKVVGCWIHFAITGGLISVDI